jgi:uncharacterized FAD-dependent dehydrogenase
MEAKPFAIGVRIEHPQSWIDKARFGECAGNDILGAAAYSLSHQCANGRTVYSFCMCPGGRVVAATSEQGRVVTNGMKYSRAEFNANSGIVVTIDPGKDYPGGPLAGIAFQRHWEDLAYIAGSNYWRRGRNWAIFWRGGVERRVRRGGAQLQAGREADRSARMSARLCDRLDP